MNSSCLPGWAHIQPNRARRLASCCQRSPGILPRSDPLPCTTSSWRQRQHEVLAEGVEEAERELVVVEAAVDRVLREVLEGVVHPAHVPLVGEAEAADVDRPAHARPGRRLLGDGEHARGAGVHDGVDLLEEARPPRGSPGPRSALGTHSPGLAGVVEVEHRRHRVDPEAVDVQLLDPVQGAGQEEVAHLVAAEVEDERAPVGVLALAGVGVLVEGGAVEAGEGPVVLGEVGRHPVDDHADARAAWRASTRNRKSSGLPKREVGAK